MPNGDHVYWSLLISNLEPAWQGGSKLTQISGRSLDNSGGGLVPLAPPSTAPMSPAHLHAYYLFSDRIRTTNNFLGDCYCAAIVEHFSKKELKLTDADRAQSYREDDELTLDGEGKVPSRPTVEVWMHPNADRSTRIDFMRPMEMMDYDEFEVHCDKPWGPIVKH